MANTESWIDSDTIIDGQSAGSSWDIVKLGAIFLPGVCTVTNLEIGRDVDVQKRRKKEKARLRDNGLSPVTFDIEIEITGRQWRDWLAVLPYVQPKEGGVRTPLGIEHPMVNAHGVNTIYIHKIRPGEPTARKGMKITIKCGEWFEEEKETKVSKTPTHVTTDWFGDPNEIVNGIQKRQGRLGPGDDVENIVDHAFGDDGKQAPALLPGDIGWHGFRTGNTKEQAPQQDVREINLGGLS